MLDFLPLKLRYKILDFKYENVYEIRIRCNKNVVITIKNKRVTLENSALNKEEIEKIVLNVCKNSIYSFDEQLKRGYVCTENGERIGIAGEFIVENGKIITIKNFQSLCIRIPHNVIGVSNEFFNKVYNGGSVLVISRSGVGKTTFIRDFTYNLSQKLNKNVVVIDERNEIFAKTDNGFINLGDYVDVLSYSTKEFGFNQAIRTLNPDYIVTDELMTKTDVNSLISTIYGGVEVVATVHSESINSLKRRSYFSNVFKYKPFNYYVLICFENSSRVYKIYDKDFNEICFY